MAWFSIVSNGPQPSAQNSLEPSAEHPGPCADWLNSHLLLLTLPSPIYSTTWRWTCKMLICSDTFLHLSQIIFKYARVNANQTPTQAEHCYMFLSSTLDFGLQYSATLCALILLEKFSTWDGGSKVASAAKGITAGIAVLRKEDIDRSKW